MSKLHAHVFKGALLSVTLKKRLDSLAAPKPAKNKAAANDVKVEGQEASSSKGQTGKKDAAPSAASRLIVRNLPWNVTEQDLRAVFLPYGPVYSTHIPLGEPIVPKEEDADAEGSSGATVKRRSKGYAFVWMLSKKDAERAVEGANGAKMSAGMADGLVRDKQKKKKLRREEAKIKQKEKERKAKQKQKAGEGDQEEEDEEENEESEEEQDVVERVIAVDWALSKDKWEEAKAKMQEQGEGEAAEEYKAEGEENVEGSDEEGEGSHIGVHDGSDEEGSQTGDNDDEDAMSVDEDASKPGRPQLPPPETGTTLFVRNVPFEATEDELRTT